MKPLQGSSAGAEDPIPLFHVRGEGGGGGGVGGGEEGVEEGGPGHEGGLVGAEVDGKGGGQGKFGGVAAATHPASVLAGLDLAEDLRPPCLKIGLWRQQIDRARCTLRSQPLQQFLVTPLARHLGPITRSKASLPGQLAGTPPWEKSIIADSLGSGNNFVSSLLSGAWNTKLGHVSPTLEIPDGWTNS
jgi:hypothetical protein